MIKIEDASSIEVRHAREIGRNGRSPYIWHSCHKCGTKRWVRYQNKQPADLICHACKKNGPAPKPLRQRLLSKIQVENGCWVWQGYKCNWGYGRIKVHGQILVVHRVAYEEFIGPIAENLEIDHLCRNRMCINPAHLEPVAHKVNIQRGTAGKYPSNGDQGRRKTHCPHGHLYDLFNTHWTKLGHRECRSCRAAQNKRRRKKL